MTIVNSGSSRKPEAMHLLRCLAFLQAKSYLRRVFSNTLTGTLSRDNRALFHAFRPQANAEPVASPESLLDVLMVSTPDWTSRNWIQLWNSSAMA